MGSPAGDVLVSPLPDFLRKAENECPLLEVSKKAERELKRWGEWWQLYRDHGFGLGFPSVNMVERINQPSSGDLWDLPPMPFEVELVDVAVRSLPVELRVVAWRWYVCYEQMNLLGCSKCVGKDLGRNVSQTLFKGWKALLLVGLAGKGVV